MKKLEEILDWGGMKKSFVFIIISVVSLIFSLFDLIPDIPFDISWIAIILCGLPIVLGAIIGLVTEFDIKADVLVSIALVASVLIHEEFAAGEIAVIMQIGAFLEEYTVSKARAGIENLVKLTPSTARKIEDGKESIIDAKDVKLNDILKVLPGETVPVDGIIISGETSINQAVMTGESLPVDKTVDDEVFSGTVNQFGAFEMKATKLGEDSSIQRMIRLVQSADADKAKIVGIADRWATWIVVAALSSAFLTWIISGEIIRAVTILVVFCPCSLVLATPTAIMAAIGNATKHGFLVKEGDALERLATVKCITFDKTGTLTMGLPKVVDVKSISDKYSEDDIYRFAASVEKSSEHPLGKALINCYKNEKDSNFDKVNNFTMVPGHGVKGLVNGKEILAGNMKMLTSENIELKNNIENLIEEQQKKGSTVIIIAIDKEAAGFIALADYLRADSKDMVDSLNSLGIKTVLITGDNESAANQIANQLNISDVHANCLPENKLNFIDKYESDKEFVCMIGDGVNDAPALKKATIGIAMGGVGSDIAVDAADIALVDDEVKELPHLFAISKKMMKKIKFNLSFSMLLNFTAIILAMTGILNPIIGALVHNCGSVFVIINSAFLLRYE